MYRVFIHFVRCKDVFMTWVTGCQDTQQACHKALMVARHQGITNIVKRFYCD